LEKLVTTQKGEMNKEFDRRKWTIVSKRARSGKGRASARKGKKILQVK